MNRLTERNEQGAAYVAIADTLPEKDQEIEGSKKLLEAIYAIFQKLAAYEDTGLEPEQIKELIKEYNKHSTLSAHYEQLEEQGLLIKLPCKVGDTLYIVSSRVDGKGHVRRLTLTHNNMGNILSRLGNDVFATKEGAEKALEASNGE